MRVLIACEFSGRVRDAFIKKGHDAVSCDLLPTEQPGPHIQGDVLEILNDGWDLMIAHYECRYMANSGVRWLHVDINRWFKLFEAAEIYNKIKNANIPKKAMENSIFHKYAIALCGRQDQVVQPWMFGSDESKGIGLQLIGLPKLVPSVTKKPSGVKQSCWKMPPSPTRAKDRARFDLYVADAMAEQWGTDTKELRYEI